MNTQPQPQRSFIEDAKGVMGWMTLIVQTLATSVQPFVHCRFGERYFGLQALAVLLLVPLYSLLWEGYDTRPLVYFMGAYLVMCLWARIGLLFRSCHAPREHSYYSGYPRLMRLFPRWNELTVKRGVEPMIVFLIGVFTLRYSEPLGMYLIIAAFGLFSSVHLNLCYERVRALDMHDAMIDQQNVTERFREMRGDRF